MTFRGGRRSRAPLMPSAQAQHLMQKLVGALAGNAKAQVATQDRTIREHITNTVIPGVIDDAQALIDAHAALVASPTVLGHVKETAEIVVDATGFMTLGPTIPRSTTFETSTPSTAAVIGHGPTGVAGEGDETGVFGLGDVAGGKFRAPLPASVALVLENLEGATGDLAQGWTNGVKTWWVDYAGNLVAQNLTALGNLVSDHHAPTTDNTYDSGTSLLRWRQVYAYGVQLLAPSIYSSDRAYAFVDATGAIIGGLGAAINAGPNFKQIELRTESIAGSHGYILAQANAASTETARVRTEAVHAAGGTARFELGSTSSLKYATVTADQTTISGGLNVGSATGAGTGEVKATTLTLSGAAAITGNLSAGNVTPTPGASKIVQAEAGGKIAAGWLPAIAVARYRTATAQSIATGLTPVIVNYDTSTYDPTSHVTTGAAWKFTCQVAGYYSVKASLMYASSTGWVAGETGSLALYKNGALYSNLDRFDGLDSATAQFMRLRGSDDILLAVGDFIDIRTFQTSGASLTFHNNADFNYVAIAQLS